MIYTLKFKGTIGTCWKPQGQTLKVKVKFTQKQATKAHRLSKFMALLFR